MRVIAGTYRSLSVSNTFMFNSNYTFWETLKSLSTLQRLFCLILSLVSAYSLLSATVILVRLRSLTNRSKVEDLSSIQRSLATLHAQSANLHQLIGAAFYLFGFIFFLTLPFAFITLGTSKVPGWTSIFQNLGFYFAFSSNVFFVFLVLHSVQWIVSSRVQASALRLNAKSIA
jgi:hypothetical protein